MSVARRVVVLSLGSNIGERRRNLRRAVNLLQTSMRVVRVSSIFESAPVDCEPGTAPFLNLAVVGLTALEPSKLLEQTQRIERMLGRRRGRRNAARTIDIDLIFVAGTSLRSSTLTLPHPRFREREFVLAPLREVVPYWFDAVSHDRISRLSGAGGVTRDGRLF